MLVTVNKTERTVAREILEPKCSCIISLKSLNKISGNGSWVVEAYAVGVFSNTTMIANKRRAKFPSLETRAQQMRPRKKLTYGWLGNYYQYTEKQLSLVNYLLTSALGLPSFLLPSFLLPRFINTLLIRTLSLLFAGSSLRCCCSIRFTSILSL